MRCHVRRPKHHASAATGKSHNLLISLQIDICSLSAHLPACGNDSRRARACRAFAYPARPAQPEDGAGDQVDHCISTTAIHGHPHGAHHPRGSRRTAGSLVQALQGSRYKRYQIDDARHSHDTNASYSGQRSSTVFRNHEERYATVGSNEPQTGRQSHGDLKASTLQTPSSTSRTRRPPARRHRSNESRCGAGAEKAPLASVARFTIHIGDQRAGCQPYLMPPAGVVGTHHFAR